MEQFEKRMYVSVAAGTWCLLVGVGQFLYAFLAIASVVFVEVLDFGLSAGKALLLLRGSETVEVPYARTLAIAIGVIGVIFAIVCFVVGAMSFYQRRASQVGIVVCISLCVLLTAIHFMNSLITGGSIYLFVGFLFSAALVVDRLVDIRAAESTMNR